MVVLYDDGLRVVYTYYLTFGGGGYRFGGE